MIDYVSQFAPITQALLATLFTWGVTSLGAGIVVFTRRVSPLLMDTSLGFAGGVMIFVVIEEVVPESQMGNNADIASIGTVLGFTTMMILDVALG